MSRDLHQELKETKYDVCIIQENIHLLKRVLSNLIDVEHYMEDYTVGCMGNSDINILRKNIADTNKCYQANKVYYRHYSTKMAKLKLEIKDHDRHQQRAVRHYYGRGFDRDAIVSSPKDAIIGEYYYFSSNISHLEDAVKHKNLEFCDSLMTIKDNKFYMKNGYVGWDYLYPSDYVDPSCSDNDKD